MHRYIWEGANPFESVSGAMASRMRKPISHDSHEDPSFFGCMGLQVGSL